MPIDSRRVQALFLAAQVTDPLGRAAFLDRECPNDPDLRQRVEALLQAHDDSGDLPAAGDLTGDFKSSASIGKGSLAAGQFFARRYKLREKLGEGGMGEVWIADQAEPVQRRIALKVIKIGLDSGRLLARFEQERQALALMDHPNIAKVLDAGVSDDGQPYFVMELVKGLSLTKYCDDARLSPKERLELFIPICQALQHAHQKGIIHRDLKPSNILIGLYDGRPVPKVIDFGVAKATSARLSEQSIYTEVGTLVGTLEYMAPEQAELNNLDIDTRADIYSLGVLLYELLTGSPPFTRKQLQSAAFTEMLRIIREVEPPRPSTKLSSSGELPSIAANRHLEPKKLTKLVTGELDWIVMKCLEKERGRRYETANGLGMDLKRYLADEPVLAGPPSAGYRFKKLMRRHKGAVVSAALVLLALVVGLIGLGWGLVQADHGRRLAERREQEANAAALAEAQAKQEALDQQAKAEAAAAAERQATLAAQKAEQAARESEADTKAYSEFLVNDVLSIARPAGERGGLGIHITVRQALEAAEKKISATFQDRPRAEAVARHDLGATFRLIGELQKAEPHLRRAVALRKQVLGLDHEDTLRSQNSLAVLLAALGNREEALPLFEETLKLRKAILGPDHINTLQSMGNLAHFYWSVGKSDLAVPLFEETLKLQKAKLGPHHRDTLHGMNNLASGYQAAGKPDLAVPLLEETLKLRRAMLHPNHPDTLTSMSNLASGYLAMGKLDLALPLLEEALKLRKATQGADHPDTLITINNLAFGYSSARQPDLALPLFKEALKLQQAKLGPDHPDTLTTMNNLASGYRDAGKPDLALPLFQQAAAGIEKRQFIHQYAGQIVGNLIACHEWLKQFDKAETWRRKWLAVVKERSGAESAAYTGELVPLGLNLLEQRKFADAEPILRECLTIGEKKEPDAWTTFNTKSMLGEALLGQKKYADAEPLLLKGYEGLKQREKTMPPPVKVRLPEAAERLVKLYEATGKQDEAAGWRTEEERYTGKLVGPVHEVGAGLELMGQLNAQTPTLAYQVRFVAGKTYLIDMVSPDQKALDPYLFLHDAAGKKLAEDDDSGGGLNARIVFRAEKDGTYRIRATTFNAGRGAFTLAVREQPMQPR